MKGGMGRWTEGRPFMGSKMHRVKIVVVDRGPSGETLAVSPHPRPGRQLPREAQAQGILGKEYSG